MKLLDRFWNKRQAQQDMEGIDVHGKTLLHGMMKDITQHYYDMDESEMEVGVYHDIASNGPLMARPAYSFPKETIELGRITINEYAAGDYIEALQPVHPDFDYAVADPEAAKHIMDQYLQQAKDIYSKIQMYVSPETLRVAQDQFNESGELSPNLREEIDAQLRNAE